MTEHRLKLTLIATAAALALSACRGDEREARIDVPDPTPPMYLADALALPYAPAAPVSWRAPDEGYRWAERAYAQQAAFYEAPPSYGFYDEGLEPLVWESADDWAMYGEPYDDGYRYYYYEPGAAYPYFVRDDDYGYAFDGAGALLSVVTATGAYLAAERIHALAPNAGRYYVRGRELRRLSQSARHVPINGSAWRERAPKVARSAQPWIEAGRRDDGWRQWRQRDGGGESRRFATAGAREARAVDREDRKFAKVEAKQDRASVKAERKDAKAERKDAKQEARDFARPHRQEARAAQSYSQPAAFQDGQDHRAGKGGGAGGDKGHGGGKGHGRGHGDDKGHGGGKKG